MKFYKYQATGNDFVVFDGRGSNIPNHVEFLSKICDRRFGIGADGVIIIQNSDTYDFKVDYYNPDGTCSLCGNGTRSAIRFAEKLGLVKSHTFFEAFDGPHEAEILPNNTIKLKMTDVQNVIHFEEGIFIDTGSPHLVQFVDDVETVDVYQIGRKLRYETPVEKGTNVNFVQIVDKSNLKIRTYERGVEQETLSCGTGVTASALAASLKGLETHIALQARGGELKVEFDSNGSDKFTNIYLIGPAEEVFEGVIEID